MAGDWIKMTKDITDKPEVRRLARALNVTRYDIVGRLHAVWSWADTHSFSGSCMDISEGDIDDIADFQGFAVALRQVGWLTGRAAALEFPHFDRHNGQTAKTRALEALKKSNQRAYSQYLKDYEKRYGNTVPEDGDTNGTNVPDETGHNRGLEKRREEYKTPPPYGAGAGFGEGGRETIPPLPETIANAEDIPEAVPVNPAPPAPRPVSSQAEPYPETAEEVEKVMAASVVAKPTGEDLKACALQFFLTNEENGWRTRENIPIMKWKAGAVRYAASWATNSQKPRKTDYPPLSPGTPPQHKSRCGPMTKGSFDWNGKPAPLPTTPNQKPQTPQ